MYKLFVPFFHGSVNSKFGLGCTYYFPEDLEGTSWFYTWGRENLSSNCIPMSWGGNKISLPSDYSGHVLVFNEPDIVEQANLSVSNALSKYNILVSQYPKAKMIVGNTSQNGLWWLRAFRDGCKIPPYAWGIHAYTNVGRSPHYTGWQIERAHEELGGKFWVTEWADTGGNVVNNQLLFDWLNSTDWIERWAYFTNRSYGTESWWLPKWKPQLWNMDGSITEVGEWWNSVVRP